MKYALAGFGVLANLFLAVSVHAGPASLVPGPALKSIAGTSQQCPSDCEVHVRVVRLSGGKCEAFVDIETVRVKANKKFEFVIYKASTDPSGYSFVGDGIEWRDSNGKPAPPPDPDEIDTDGPHSPGKVKWKTGNKKSIAERRYVPVVRNAAGPCSATDPKIINDG